MTALYGAEGNPMKECICSTCVHLHDVLGENGPTGETECQYGFPGEACDTCESGECELECANWKDAEDTPTMVTVRCAACGKEMQADADDGEDGEVFCVQCYLARDPSSLPS